MASPTAAGLRSAGSVLSVWLMCKLTNPVQCRCDHAAIFSPFVSLALCQLTISEEIECVLLSSI